jgi:hypothetical protein
MMAKVFENPDPITVFTAPEMLDFSPSPVHHVMPFPVPEKSEVF